MCLFSYVVRRDVPVCENMTSTYLFNRKKTEYCQKCQKVVIVCWFMREGFNILLLASLLEIHFAVGIFFFLLFFDIQY